MPKVSQEHKDARRDQILTAAIQCFSRKGVHATTMADICDESELSRGAVYGYFQSKREIVQAVFEGFEASTRTFFDQATRDRSATRGLLGAARDAMLQLGHPAARNLLKLDQSLKGEIVHDKEALGLCQQNLAANLPPMVAIVRAIQAEGSIPPDADPQHVARVLIAVQDGLKYQLLLQPGLDVNKFVDTVATVMFRGRKKPW